MGYRAQQRGFETKLKLQKTNGEVRNEDPKVKRWRI